MDDTQGRIINLPKMADPRGNLTVAEGLKDIPFHISRVYWVYDVPSGESRGGHAHRHCREFIIAAGGSFTVTLDDGKSKKTFLLNHPYQGLLVNKTYGGHSTTFRRVPCALYLPKTNSARMITYATTPITSNT